MRLLLRNDSSGVHQLPQDACGVLLSRPRDYALAELGAGVHTKTTPTSQSLALFHPFGCAVPMATYSITLSARAWSVGGTVTPSGLAVLRFSPFALSLLLHTM